MTPRRSTLANSSTHDNTAQRHRAWQSMQQGAAARGNPAQHHTTCEAQQDTAQHDTARRTPNNTTQQAATQHHKAQNKPTQHGNTNRQKARHTNRGGGGGSTRRHQPSGARNREGRERTRPQPQHHTATQTTPQHATMDDSTIHDETAGRSGTNSNGAAQGQQETANDKANNTADQHRPQQGTDTTEQQGAAKRRALHKTAHTQSRHRTTRRGAAHTTGSNRRGVGGGEHGTSTQRTERHKAASRGGKRKPNQTGVKAKGTGEKHGSSRRTQENGREGEDTKETRTGEMGAGNKRPSGATPGEGRWSTEEHGRQGDDTRETQTRGGGQGDSRRRQQTEERRRVTTKHGGNRGKRGAGPHRPQNANPPEGGTGYNRGLARDTKEQTGGQKTTSGGIGLATLGWGGRSSRRQQTPAHGPEPRRHEKTEGEQGKMSGRATTAAKQKHRVAHRMRSGGQPVRPGQDKEVAHHTRSGGPPVRPGQANTTDNQHPTTPAVRRRRQQRTNKTSRASSRLQHHEPIPERANTARPTKGGATHKHGTPQQGRAKHQHSTNPGRANNTTGTATHLTDDNNPSQRPPLRRARTNTARPTKRGATHQHTTLHHEGGHKPTPHAPPMGGHTPTQHARPWGGARTYTARLNRGGGGARTSTAPTPARQTPQTTKTGQRRLYGG